MATSKKNTQAEKMECMQRLALHGSTEKLCAKRYNVSESTVKKWVKQHQEGELFKRHPQWSQHWDKPTIIHHFVDLDVLQSIKRGKPTYEDSIISLFDPELDPINGLAHVEWKNNDIDKLCLWMIDRSLEIIRDVGLSTDDFKEEMKFVESPFFEMICKAFGYDVDAIRKGIYRAVAARAAAEDEKIEQATQHAPLNVQPTDLNESQSIQESVTVNA